MQRSSLRPRAVFGLQRAPGADSTELHGLEWLEVDGLGGYAAGTVSGCPTRRYHGLLTVRPRRGAPRHLFLARVEEQVRRSDGSRRDFSVARYGEVLSPHGHESFDSFELRPWPCARYAADGLELSREVLRVRGEATVLLRYRVAGSRPGDVLRLRPLFACREAGALTFENAELDPEVRSDEQGFRFRPYAALPAVWVRLGAAAHDFVRDPQWYRGITYEVDARRGYDSREDHFSPGLLEVPLDVGGEIVLAARVGEAPAEPRSSFEREARQRAARMDQCVARMESAGPDALCRATLAADAFLYRDESGRAGILAGFPWFEEWGRDTFVSLPGLSLARGDLATCGAVLAGALPFLRRGLLPNVFGATPASSHYGSADAALWFARAVGLYRLAGAEPGELVERYLPALESIVEAYRAGTALGIAVGADGLLRAGTSELNATWMDARTSAGPVTPRAGCPVELNALWYALLAELEEQLALAGAAARRERARRAREAAGRAFLERFWLPDVGRLADCVDGPRVDASLRPNMVIAAALEQSPLSPEQRASIVDHARRHLLTPHGLRSLAPGEPGYRGRFEGGPEQRDASYHQGTVWPWLLGFFTEASLRAGAREGRAELLSLWSTFESELDRAGLGHVSEVFDGDEPRRPGGTFAQAWNTAEYLRARALLSREGPCAS